MAIDTRDKRFAMIGLALPIRVFPNPDGDIANEADRVHHLYMYPGILPSGSTPAVAGIAGMMLRRRRGVR